MKLSSFPTLAARLLFVFVTIGAHLMVSRPAFADEDAATVSVARELFDEGRKLVREGKHAEACPKFEESLRLAPGIGTQFNLADCWERMGRTASASALFSLAAASANAAGQADREQALRERAAALEPRLSKLTVEVPEQNTHLVVALDDSLLDRAKWGIAVPLDPGTHTISARARGKKEWRKTVYIHPDASSETVRVPELEADAVIEPSAERDSSKPAMPPSAPSAPNEPPAVTQAGRSSKSTVWAISAASVGAAALTTGVVAGLQYRSAHADAKAICPSGVNCTQKEIQDHRRAVDDSKTARAWSYAGFAVGTLALAGGAVLWLLGHNDGRGTGFVAVPLVAVDGGAFAGMQGSF